MQKKKQNIASYKIKIIFQMSSKVIYLRFLNGIKFKFQKYFFNDRNHLVFFQQAEKGNLNAFLHLIECSIAKINSSKCLACLNNDNVFTCSKVNLFYKQLSLFFHCYYGCPLFVCERFFSLLKISIYSDDGMHLLDCGISLLNFFKYQNRFLKEKTFFLGNIYEKENEQLFYENLNLINMSITKKKDEDENQAHGFKKFALLGLTGTIFEPLHYFAIFIDISTSSIYIYNSCPKKVFSCLKNKKNLEQDNLSFDNNITVQRFSKWFPSFKIYCNTFRNQFNNELCAFFAGKFLKDMSQSKQPQKVFEKYDAPKNMDRLIFEKQNDFIIAIKERYKLINIFFKFWNQDNN